MKCSKWSVTYTTPTYGLSAVFKKKSIDELGQKWGILEVLLIVFEKLCQCHWIYSFSDCNNSLRKSRFDIEFDRPMQIVNVDCKQLQEILKELHLNINIAMLSIVYFLSNRNSPNIHCEIQRLTHWIPLFWWCTYFLFVKPHIGLSNGPSSAHNWKNMQNYLLHDKVSKLVLHGFTHSI